MGLTILLAFIADHAPIFGYAVGYVEWHRFSASRGVCPQIEDDAPLIFCMDKI